MAPVFSFTVPLPISNLPPSVQRVRLRLRANDYARAILRTATTTEHWYLALSEDKQSFRLAVKIGLNQRPATRAA